MKKRIYIKNRHLVRIEKNMANKTAGTPFQMDCGEWVQLITYAEKAPHGKRKAVKWAYLLGYLDGMNHITQIIMNHLKGLKGGAA